MLLAKLGVDPVFKRDLIRYFSIGAIFYVLAAVIAVGYIHPDQHFQTLEFAHVKTSPGNENLMVWEYRSKIRPWTQPYIYIAVISGLKAIGVDNPFVHDAVIRLATGLAGMTALLLFCISISNWLPHAAQKRWLAILFGLFWLFPYNFTRTSSEALTSIFLLLALAALVLLRKGPHEDPLSQSGAGPFSGPIQFSLSGLMLSGFCMGLMFNVRYQMGIVIVAFVLWMLIVHKTSIRQLGLFCVVIVATVALGVLLDSKGYGAFEFVPWNYLRVNLLEGRAAEFGTDPWYFYILSMLVWPVGPVLLAAAVLFWFKYPKNVITWMTLLFVVVHTALSHKETRFLIPITPLILAGLIFVFPEKWFLKSASGNPFKEHSQWVRWAFYFFVASNLVALTAASVRLPRPAIATHQFIHRIEPDHYEFYSLGATPYRLYQTGGPRFEFYAPGKVTHHRLGSPSELLFVLEKKSPIYFYHPNHKLPDSSEFNPIREHCQLLHRSFDPALNDWNFGDWMARVRTASIYRCG